MYNKLMNIFKYSPKVYESTGIDFWDDEYISYSMLRAHLSPESDGASRKHAFIKRSAKWIDSFSQVKKELLDLGCGPGIYAELFHDLGYSVTGVDFSKRSINYATTSALNKGKSINYIYKDYLTIDFNNKFDIVTLIYCDFGVLSIDNRKILLKNIFKALKPGGRFFLDVFSINQYKNFTDNIETTFEESGFWRKEPYLCIKKNKCYEENVFLEQYTIITDNEQQTYNLWNHAFSQEELISILEKEGFVNINFYGDVAGKPIESNDTTICVVCEKPL